MQINHFTIKRLLIVTLLLSFIPTTAISAGKHALLIGIQDYSGTGFHSLKGPVNDIHLTQNMLRQRFGISNQNLITLLDAQATHTGIEQAFQALIQRVKPGDFVYIHYSGHGSQTADLNGDQKRGKHDQTWVSYGARSSNQAHKDNYDVLDDEINAWMAALYAKTDQIVFVSDSCHSATVSRGAELIRAVDEDKRPHILGKRRYTQTTYRGIRVGSARDFESAIGKSRTNGQYYGAFTWHWVRNLQQARSGDTWNHIYKRTYTQLTAERAVQQPQIEGEHRQHVLGGGFTAQPPTISVEKIASNWIKLSAGSLSGVTEGSVYRLYKPHHPNPQSLPSLTITEVEPFASNGKPTGTFKTGDLVVEESHVYHFEPIKVLLDADDPNGKDKPLLQAIQAAFQPHYGGRNFPAYRLTHDQFQTDLRLDIVRPKDNQAPELRVLTPDGRLFNPNLKMSFHDTKKGLQLLQDNLNKLARIRELKRLQSRRSRRLPVTLQTLLLTPDKNCISGPDCVELPNDLGWHRKTGPYTLPEIETHTLNEGDILTFSLHNRSRRRDYYCYIFNITPKGAIYSIFPEPEDGMEYARVKARETRELIEESGLMAEGAGEETIKLLISRYPIDVSLLEQGPFEQRGDNLNPLEQLLFAHTVHGIRGKISLRNDNWATALAAFEVR